MQPLLPKADGSTWNMSHQLRPMADAITRAKIKPAVSFHGRATLGEPQP